MSVYTLLLCGFVQSEVQELVTRLREANKLSDSDTGRQAAVANAAARLKLLLEEGGWPPEPIEKLLADRAATVSGHDGLELFTYFSDSSSSSSSSSFSSDSDSSDDSSSADDDSSSRRRSSSSSSIDREYNVSPVQRPNYRRGPRMVPQLLPEDFKVSHSLQCIVYYCTQCTAIAVYDSTCRCCSIDHAEFSEQQKLVIADASALIDHFGIHSYSYSSAARSTCLIAIYTLASMMW
jgi:hypothetical protein